MVASNSNKKRNSQALRRRCPLHRPIARRQTGVLPDALWAVPLPRSAAPHRGGWRASGRYPPLRSGGGGTTRSVVEGVRLGTHGSLGVTKKIPRPSGLCALRLWTGVSNSVLGLPPPLAQGSRPSAGHFWQNKLCNIIFWFLQYDSRKKSVASGRPTPCAQTERTTILAGLDQRESPDETRPQNQVRGAAFSPSADFARACQWSRSRRKSSICRRRLSRFA